MADINYEELEDLTLTMEDEDGTTTECELQFVFEYDGQDYGAFCEAENETGEFYFFSIDGSTNWKGETELEIAPVEDDALLEQLVDVLQQIIDSEMSDIDVEDEDDAEESGLNPKLDKAMTIMGIVALAVIVIVKKSLCAETGYRFAI